MEAVTAGMAAGMDQVAVTGRDSPAIDLMVDAGVIHAATSELMQAAIRGAAIVASRIVLEAVGDWTRQIASGHRSARIDAKDVIEVLSLIGDNLAAAGSPDGSRVVNRPEGGA